MKSKLLALALGAVGAIVTATAVAAPLPTFPGGPFFIQFSNREQIAVVGNTGSAFGDAAEINWGVLLINTINPGNISISDPNVINTTGSSWFNNISGGGQITGMFYGLHAGTPNISNPFPATGGFLDLYYRDLDVLGVTDISLAMPSLAGNGLRTALDKADGYTDGQFLARIAFASGIDADPTNFVKGTAIPGPGGFAGFATSFANVVTGLGGAWEEKLDTDHFAPPAVPGVTRDLRFRNIYEELSDWDGCTYGVGFCLGASSSDPATGIALPEPGSMALVGLGLLGLAAIRRRKV